jgi:hypothetical protein
MVWHRPRPGRHASDAGCLTLAPACASRADWWSCSFPDVAWSAKRGSMITQTILPAALAGRAWQCCPVRIAIDAAILLRTVCVPGVRCFRPMYEPCARGAGFPRVSVDRSSTPSNTTAGMPLLVEWVRGCHA